jgi:hypothetical protein
LLNFFFSSCFLKGPVIFCSGVTDAMYLFTMKIDEGGNH